MKYPFKYLRYAAAFSCVMLTAVTYAQQGENLVPNGSFEATDGKVKKLGSIESANGWTSPTGARADLFTPNKVADINTPMNKYGKEDAKDGTNYAGFVGFSYGNKVPRSYVMVKLDAPLKKGMSYCVKFYVSLAEASKYASNEIGANFSKKPFATNEKTMIKDVAHIKHYNNDQKKINQTFAWEQICGTFVAEGGEKYLTIGNFSPDDQTKSESMKKNKDMKIEQIIAAYYYLDDVSVTLMDETQKCNCLVQQDKDEFTTTIYQKSIIVNDKMTPTQKIQAQQLFFAFGKSSFTTVAEESLNLIAEWLKANPVLKIEVIGHNDAEEDKLAMERPIYENMDEMRVDAVKRFLVEKGIQENRISTVTKNADVPNDEITENDDADLQLAKNRRVVFVVK